jgi:two-component system OmpR family sensor kinase
VTDAVTAHSLRRRLALGLSAGVTALWLTAIVAAAVVVRHELDEVFDSALQETAERILPLAVIELIDTEDDNGTARRVSRVSEHEEYLTYVVRDRTGAILLSSHDADPATFADAPEAGFRNTNGHRIYSRSVVSGAYTIEVAEPLAHRREATLEAIAALLLPLAVLAPLSLIGIWVYVTRSLRPILRLRSDIATRGGADLSPVETRGLPNEIEAIGASVNQLLSRLRRTLEAERSFTSNSAHELRTPIAATLAQAQRLIAEVPEGPLRDRARRIEADLLRLSRLSEKLMQLARAEGGGIVSAAPQDLAPVLALVVEDFHRSGDGARLRLRLPADGAAPSAMDADAFAILARNLIENALRHGDPGPPIEVEMTAAGALRVVNGGAIVPPDRLAHLKTRFARGTSPAEGSGLGLAIAEAIVVHAGATLSLHSPATGRSDGFEAVVEPPQATP